jgi:hypothetical protein
MGSLEGISIPKMTVESPVIRALCFTYAALFWEHSQGHLSAIRKVSRGQQRSRPR